MTAPNFQNLKVDRANKTETEKEKIENRMRTLEKNESERQKNLALFGHVKDDLEILLYQNDQRADGFSDLTAEENKEVLGTDVKLDDILKVVEKEIILTEKGIMDAEVKQKKMERLKKIKAMITQAKKDRKSAREILTIEDLKFLHKEISSRYNSYLREENEKSELTEKLLAI